MDDGLGDLLRLGRPECESLVGRENAAGVQGVLGKDGVP